jgi:hypothetical protein
MLGTLRDARGNTTVTGLESSQTWTGAPYPPEQFRDDAGLVEVPSCWVTAASPTCCGAAR